MKRSVLKDNISSYVKYNHFIYRPIKGNRYLDDNTIEIRRGNDYYRYIYGDSSYILLATIPTKLYKYLTDYQKNKIYNYRQAALFILENYTSIVYSKRKVIGRYYYTYDEFMNYVKIFLSKDNLLLSSEFEQILNSTVKRNKQIRVTIR